MFVLLAVLTSETNVNLVLSICRQPSFCLLEALPEKRLMTQYVVLTSSVHCTALSPSFVAPQIFFGGILQRANCSAVVEIWGVGISKVSYFKSTQSTSLLCSASTAAAVGTSSSGPGWDSGGTSVAINLLCRWHPPCPFHSPTHVIPSQLGVVAKTRRHRSLQL